MRRYTRDNGRTLAEANRQSPRIREIDLQKQCSRLTVQGIIFFKHGILETISRIYAAKSANFFKNLLTNVGFYRNLRA